MTDVKVLHVVMTLLTTLMTAYRKGGEVNCIVIKTTPKPYFDSNIETNCSSILMNLPSVSLAPHSINYTGIFPRPWVKRHNEATVSTTTKHPSLEVPTADPITLANDSTMGLTKVFKVVTANPGDTGLPLTVSPENIQPTSPSATLGVFPALGASSLNPIKTTSLLDTGAEQIIPTISSTNSITLPLSKTSFAVPIGTTTSPEANPPQAHQQRNASNRNSFSSEILQNSSLRINSKDFSTTDNAVLKNMTRYQYDSKVYQQIKEPVLKINEKVSTSFENFTSTTEETTENSYISTVTEMSTMSDGSEDTGSFNIFRSITYFLFDSSKEEPVTPSTKSGVDSAQLPTVPSPTKSAHTKKKSARLVDTLKSPETRVLRNIEKSEPMDTISLEKELHFELASRLPLALDEDLLDLWGAPYYQRLKSVNHEMVDIILQTEIEQPPESSECPMNYQETLLTGMQRILGLLLLSLPQSLKEAEEVMWDNEIDNYFLRHEGKSILDINSCVECYTMDPSGVCREIFFCKNGLQPTAGVRLTPQQLQRLLAGRK